MYVIKKRCINGKNQLTTDYSYFCKTLSRQNGKNPSVAKILQIFVGGLFKLLTNTTRVLSLRREGGAKLEKKFAHYMRGMYRETTNFGGLEYKATFRRRRHQSSATSSNGH